MFALLATRLPGASPIPGPLRVVWMRSVARMRLGGMIPGVAETRTRRWYAPMVARDTGEPHRVATSLELLFDLCFVVAVARAAAQLHHDLSAGHAGHGVLGYVMVFFAIWWAWVNFTWFASAYDTDDAVYRLTTLIQISGVLILAAGVTRAADHDDFRVVTVGYVVMRLALVAQWLRAAHGDPCLLHGRGRQRWEAHDVSRCHDAWHARPEVVTHPDAAPLVRRDPDVRLCYYLEGQRPRTPLDGLNAAA